MNALANEALPLFLDKLVPSYVAVIISVSLVLFFGEIIPSAIFTGPNQLAISSKLAPFVKFILFVLAPIAWPIAKILDYFLHDDEHASLEKYNSNELRRDFSKRVTFSCPQRPFSGRFQTRSAPYQHQSAPYRPVQHVTVPNGLSSSFFRKRTKQLLCSTITIAISTSDINNKSNIIIINFSTNSSSRSINTKSVNNGGSSVVGSPCMFEMKVLLRRMMNRVRYWV